MLKCLKIFSFLPYLIVLLIFGVMHNPCFSESTVLTILHTNDTYGRLLPFSKDGTEFGGVLRRAYIIRQIQNETPNSVIVLDAGDAIAPYPLSAFDQGKTVIEMMNEMGYTAMSLGNHEFDYGVGVLRNRISEAKFAMLSNNTIVNDTGKPLSQGYITTEVADIKVGIIGLTTPTTRYRAAPQLQTAITFNDPFTSTKDAVKELKAQGCNFIIALSHLGYQNDMELSAQVDGINLIVGGEIRSYDEKLITFMSPVDYATGASLVYCPWFGGYVGRVDVYLEKQDDGKYVVRDLRMRKYRLDEKSYPDEVVDTAVPDLKKKLDRLVSNYNLTYMGTLGSVAKNEEIKSQDLIPLIVRNQAKTEIVLLNNGTLKPVVFKDEIKRIQVMETIQYPNQIYVLELSGAQLQAALSHSSKQINENRKLVFSGIDDNGAAVNGRPINPNEYYTVATNDFLAYGGDGYDMIATGRKRKGTGLMLHQVVIDYIQSLKSSGRDLSLKSLRASLPRYVIKSKIDMGLLFEGLTVSEEAKKYPQINQLQSKNVGDFLYWNVAGGFSVFLAAPVYYLEANLLSKYGRLQHPRMKSIKLDDNLQGSVLFRLLPGKWILDPIVRFEVENVEFTPSDARHTITQVSAGAERKLIPGVTTTLGVLLRSHRPEKTTQTQLSMDFRLKYQAQIKGIAVQSELKFFPVFRDTASDEPLFTNYITSFVNSVKFPLNKYLFLTANAVLYRETQTGPWAHEADIAIQIIQKWGKKP